MPVDRLEVRVSITKLLLALIIVIVPLSIIGLMLTERSDRSLDNSVGSNFKTIAQLYANEVSQYMRDRLADVSAIANNPAITNAAADGKGSTAASAGMLGSSASQYLRQRKAIDNRFLSIVATDVNGNVVAASQQPPKTSYAQDPTWQSAYNNGQAGPKISNIVDDEFTKSYYVNIDVPIGDATSGTSAGIVTAAVNVTDLLARFKQEVGNGARAEIVNDDGTIVSAPNADVFANLKSQAFDVVRDSIGAAQGSQSGWQMAQLRNGPYIVGYAATGLKQHFSNLGWVVLVSQAEHQAAAPVRGLQHFALVMVILALFMLTLIFVYYYLHRTQRFSDIQDEPVPEDRTRAAAASR